MTSRRVSLILAMAVACGLSAHAGPKVDPGEFCKHYAKMTRPEAGAFWTGIKMGLAVAWMTSVGHEGAARDLEIDPRLETAHRKNSVLPVLFFELFELNMRSDSQAIPTRSLNNSPCKRKDAIRANTMD